MQAYVRQRAIEPFFTTKPTGKGTGLGLAMVHGFVQQSLGKLDIISAPGEGATIRMQFPVFKETLREAPTEVKLPPPRSGHQGPETILLVEDNEDVMTIALEHLTVLGYEVLTARNADEALEVLAGLSAKIDLLFSDILMPGSINGIMLAERVCTEFPHIAILLATGYNEDLVVDGPSAPSTMDVLGKPYRRSELSDRVRAALNRRADSARASLAPRPATGPRHEA
jgi:CheY-like chemotaxis protein